MLEREGRRWGEEQHSLIPLLIGRWWALLALLLLQAAAEILAEGLCSPLLSPTLAGEGPHLWICLAQGGLPAYYICAHTCVGVHGCMYMMPSPDLG